MSKDLACPLCDMLARLMHILDACKVNLDYGKFKFEMKTKMKSQVETMSTKRKLNIFSTLTTPVAVQLISFVHKENQKARSTAPARKGPLEGAWQWQMLVDVGQTAPNTFSHINLTTETRRGILVQHL